MKVFRVAQERHAASAREMLSGEGAAKYGGRWNSVGVPAVYCSESLSLCALEILVHLPRGVLRRYRYVEVEVPAGLIKALDWPHVKDEAESAHIGDSLLGKGGVLGFSVPSVVNPMERNVVLNPGHPRFPGLSVGTVRAFPLDSRLLER